MAEKLATFVLVVEYDTDVTAVAALEAAKELTEKAQELGRVGKATVKMHTMAIDLVTPPSWAGKDAMIARLDKELRE